MVWDGTFQLKSNTDELGQENSAHINVEAAVTVHDILAKLGEMDDDKADKVLTFLEKAGEKLEEAQFLFAQARKEAGC